MDHYILYLEQLDGENNKLLFSSNDVINQNLGWNNPTKVYYRGTIIIPTVETMANVKTTIAKYGLDTTTEFTSPVVGTGVVGQTVSMPS